MDVVDSSVELEVEEVVEEVVEVVVVEVDSIVEVVVSGAGLYSDAMKRMQVTAKIAKSEMPA